MPERLVEGVLPVVASNWIYGNIDEHSLREDDGAVWFDRIEVTKTDRLMAVSNGQSWREKPSMFRCNQLAQHPDRVATASAPARLATVGCV